MTSSTITCLWAPTATNRRSCLAGRVSAVRIQTGCGWPATASGARLSTIDAHPLSRANLGGSPEPPPTPVCANRRLKSALCFAPYALKRDKTTFLPLSTPGLNLPATVKTTLTVAYSYILYETLTGLSTEPR